MKQLCDDHHSFIWDMPAIHYLCSVFQKGLLWFGLRKLLSCLWSIELIVELENMKICSLYLWRNYKVFSQLWFTNFCLIVGLGGLCIFFDTLTSLFFFVGWRFARFLYTTLNRTSLRDSQLCCPLKLEQTTRKDLLLLLPLWQEMR